MEEAEIKDCFADYFAKLSHTLILIVSWNYAILRVLNVGGTMLAMDTNQVVGVIYKNGDDDFSVWLPELSVAENKEVNVLLEKFANSGCSTRGTKQDAIDEATDSLK